MFKLDYLSYCCLWIKSSYYFLSHHTPNLSSKLIHKSHDICLFFSVSGLWGHTNKGQNKLGLTIFFSFRQNSFFLFCQFRSHILKFILQKIKFWWLRAVFRNSIYAKDYRENCILRLNQILIGGTKKNKTSIWETKNASKFHMYLNFLGKRLNDRWKYKSNWTVDVIYFFEILLKLCYLFNIIKYIILNKIKHLYIYIFKYLSSYLLFQSEWNLNTSSKSTI